MYVAEEEVTMVAQGKIVDTVTVGELQQLATDEMGVALPTETVLRAAALFLAEHDRPAMLAEVRGFLAQWEGSR